MAVKKIKTKGDLNKMALATGATVTDQNGRQFNSSKNKADPVAEPEKKKEFPKPAPAKAVPPGPDPGMKLLADKVEASGRDTALMLAEIARQMVAIQMSAPQLITEWTFDFVRNDKGYLTQVKASAGNKLN